MCTNENASKAASEMARASWAGLSAEQRADRARRSWETRRANAARKAEVNDSDAAA